MIPKFLYGIYYILDVIIDFDHEIWFHRAMQAVLRLLMCIIGLTIILGGAWLLVQLTKWGYQ